MLTKRWSAEPARTTTHCKRSACHGSDRLRRTDDQSRLIQLHDIHRGIAIEEVAVRYSDIEITYIDR